MAKTPVETVDKAPVPIRRMPGRSQAADVFWSFWEDCNKKWPNRVYAYLYRGWPVIDRTQTGKKNKLIDKLFYTPQEGILNGHGSGDYKLVLHDGHGGMLGMTYVQLRDDDCPPKLDLAELKVDDPKNAGYIRDLRAKGIRLPGETGGEEMNEMLMGKLVDKVISNSTSAPAAPGAALETAVQVMGAAATKSNELLAGTYQTIAMQFKQQDPVEQLGGLVAVVEKLQRPDSTPQLVEMMRVMIQESRADRQLVIQALNDRKRRTPEEEEEADPLMARLKERVMDRAMEVLDGNASQTPSMSPSTVAAMVGFAKELVPLLQFGMQMWAASRQTSVQPPPTPSSPNPADLVTATTTAQPTVDPYQQMLTEIERPLIRFWSDNEKGGAAFAELVIEYHGREVYDVVKQSGPDALASAINRHPSIGPVLLSDPARTQEFLAAFLGYDQIVEETSHFSESEPLQPQQQQQQQELLVEPVSEVKTDKESRARTRSRSRSKAA